MATPLQKVAKESDRILEEVIQDWMAVANLAYSAVDKKIEDAPRDYWLVALAGNLGWAIAGFFPVTTTIKLIVLGNAVLGAGPADKIAQATKVMPPTVDKILAGRIAETADALETHFRTLRKNFEWEKNFAEVDVDDPTQSYDMKLALWRKVFPNVDYTKRRQDMLKIMIANIESQMSSFKRQWAWWKKNYYRPYITCMDKEVEKYPQAFIGTPYQAMRDRCFAAHPDTLETFRPQLDFPLVVTDTVRPAPDGRPISKDLKSYGSFPVPIR
jgi:hypothetical protein